MTKKEVECQVHTWMIKKAKKPWYIRRGKTGEKGIGTEKKENQISRACPKRLIAKNYAHSFSFLTLKSNILAQDSDQLSLPHSINLLFRLFGLRSIPILDSSQIWSLQLCIYYDCICIQKYLFSYLYIKNIMRQCSIGGCEHGFDKDSLQN